jgi:hypothetical protein
LHGLRDLLSRGCSSAGSRFDESTGVEAFASRRID